MDVDRICKMKMNSSVEGNRIMISLVGIVLIYGCCNGCCNIFRISVVEVCSLLLPPAI
jgi:hypothetical protein